MTEDEYFTKKMQYLRFQATQENEDGTDMEELRKEILAYEYDCGGGEDCGEEEEAIEYGMKEEREYFTKKMQYLRFQATQENEDGTDMEELRKEILAYEKLYNTVDETAEHEEDDFDREIRAHQEWFDANLARHEKNVLALALYYEHQGDDAEYEFWLVFEIRAYESDCMTNVVDVELAQYGAQATEDDRADWHYQDYDDEQDRLEKYIEGKRADEIHF